MFTIMLSTKGFLLLILSVLFRSYEFTTVLSPADRVVNGQDIELVCTNSLTIDPASTVFVSWVEGNTTRGNLDKNCDDTFGPVDTTQYNFSCLSIQNYTWTIMDVQEARNGSVWTCEIAIDSPNYASSDPTTIYVISPITNVSIDGNTNVSADAGSQTTVSCTTSTGRPVSTIRWYFDAGTSSDTSDDIEITPTLEPVFDFESETTSGSVAITAESNITGWRIYATANNTESMPPIQSSNAVTLTVTASTGSTPDDCEICKWCVIIPWCWCIVLLVIGALIILTIIVGICTLGYWKIKEKYIFDKLNPRWPCSSRNKSDGSDETENRPLSTTVETTNETSPETKSLQSTKHDGYQVNNHVVQTEGSSPSPIKKGHSKVGPDDNQRSGDPEKNTAGSIREVNNERINAPRPLPILPKIGSKESSQAPNMGDVEANKPKKKKKKKKGIETKEDQIV